MAEMLAGFPFWTIAFNDGGQPENAQAVDTFVAEAKAQGLTDLFIFSHGWNNDHAAARTLYTGFYGEVAKLMADPNTPKKRQAVIGVAGVYWPSIKWPDNDGDPMAAPAAASMGGAGDNALATELKKVFLDPKQQTLVDEMTAMLDERPESEDDLKRFKEKLSALVAGGGAQSAPADALEQQGMQVDDDAWKEVFESLASQESGGDDAGMGGGAAAFGIDFGRLWNGAKAALRTATYWQMKKRAGAVGRNGLGPLLGRLQAAIPDIKIHLLGHSFGARLVSYSLSGLPDSVASGKSPVKSLFLLQGAFSHFAFADKLPFDANRKGDLAGMAKRVDGPLVTTHSLKDAAVGTAYPLASLVNREDAAAADDATFRWGAMGHDGAQAVNATEKPLGKPGTVYPFQTGQWINLDGNQVIINGGPPSGAHSDIIHPHTAWAALAAAGIA